MNKIESQLKNLKNSVHMSTAERSVMNERLQEYVALTPARTPLPAPTKTGRVTSLFIHIVGYRYMPALLMFVLLTTSGVGVAYASEQALPDERLYSVKEFIEEAHAKVLLTDDARIAWAEQRAERRLQEVQRLSELGRLSDEQVERMETRIAKHTERAEVVLTRLQESKPEKVLKVRASLEQKKMRMQEVRKVRAQVRTEQEVIPATQLKPAVRQGAQRIQTNTIIKKQELQRARKAQIANPQKVR